MLSLIVILIIIGYKIFRYYRAKNTLEFYFSGIKSLRATGSQGKYTIVQDINEVSEHAECPYGDGNIQKTFGQTDVVKCASCGAFHHRDCFDSLGKCGSLYCMGK